MSYRTFSDRVLDAGAAELLVFMRWRAEDADRPGVHSFSADCGDFVRLTDDQMKSLAEAHKSEHPTIVMCTECYDDQMEELS